MTKVKNQQRRHHDQRQHPYCFQAQKHRPQVLSGSGLLLLALIVALTTVRSSSAAHNQNKQQQYLYDCPSKPLKTTARNDIPGYFSPMDEATESHQRHEALDPTNYYVTDFRDARHGGHPYTYNEYKKLARNWRSTLFGSELHSGDSIYEGAGAEGFNLFTTAEILKEESGIEELTLYGHDYLEPSVEVANKFFDVQLTLGLDGEKLEEGADSWFKKGRYCQGDSTNLFFVPSNSMDLAYTYVDPLIDGLGRYDDSDPCYERVKEMMELCDSDKEEDQLIVVQDQKLQEEWHSMWVKELIRIVKPGKLAVIENLEGPICSEGSEWGGVVPEWWAKAAVEYEWNVDVDSIRIHNEPILVNTYCVSMRKKDTMNKEEGEEEEEEDEDMKKEL